MIIPAPYHAPWTSCHHARNWTNDVPAETLNKHSAERSPATTKVLFCHHLERRQVSCTSQGQILSHHRHTCSSESPSCLKLTSVQPTPSRAHTPWSSGGSRRVPHTWLLEECGRESRKASLAIGSAIGNPPGRAMLTRLGDYRTALCLIALGGHAASTSTARGRI